MPPNRPPPLKSDRRTASRPLFWASVPAAITSVSPSAWRSVATTLNVEVLPVARSSWLQSPAPAGRKERTPDVSFGLRIASPAPVKSARLTGPGAVSGLASFGSAQTLLPEPQFVLLYEFRHSVVGGENPLLV